MLYGNTSMVEEGFEPEKYLPDDDRITLKQ